MLKVAWHASGASVDAHGDRPDVHVAVVESIQEGDVRTGRVELPADEAEAMGHALIAAASIARGAATSAAGAPPSRGSLEAVVAAATDYLDADGSEGSYDARDMNRARLRLYAALHRPLTDEMRSYQAALKKEAAARDAPPEWRTVLGESVTRVCADPHPEMPAVRLEFHGRSAPMSGATARAMANALLEHADHAEHRQTVAESKFPRPEPKPRPDDGEHYA